MNKTILKNLSESFLKYDAKNSLDDLLSMCNIKTLFCEEYGKNLSPLEKYLLTSQRKLIVREIINLFKLANSINVEIILLKGIAESYDLYPNPIYRPSNDIDLLIRTRDVLKFSMACKDLGYRLENNEISEEFIKINIDYIGHHHLDKFIKQENPFTLVLELHVALDASWNNLQEETCENLMEEIFSHKCKYNLDNKSIFICDIYDRLIFSLQHSARHLYDSVRSTWLYKNYSLVEIDLKTLIDSILLLDKYFNYIDQDILYNRIEKYGFSENIVLANKLAFEIFEKSILCNERLKNLKTYSFNFWKDQIYKYLRTLFTCRDFFTLHISEIHKVIVKKCLDQNEHYISSCEKCNNIIIDQENDTLTKRRFGTICRCNLIPKNNYKGKIFVYHDNLKLYIDFNITDSNVMVGGLRQQNKWTESINIIIYNPENTNKNIITGIFLMPIITDTGMYKINAQYIGEWWDRRSSSIFPLVKDEAVFSLTDVGYNIRLQLLWEKLEIDYSKIDYLGMDFILNNVDTNEAKLDAVLCWSNPANDYYNPASLGMVSFTKPKIK